jgi:hypothetical protein
MLFSFAPVLDLDRLQQPHFLEQFKRADAAVSFQGRLDRKPPNFFAESSKFLENFGILKNLEIPRISRCLIAKISAIGGWPFGRLARPPAKPGISYLFWFERGASPQRAVTSEQQSQPPKGPTHMALIFAIKH